MRFLICAVFCFVLLKGTEGGLVHLDSWLVRRPPSSSMSLSSTVEGQSPTTSSSMNWSSFTGGGEFCDLTDTCQSAVSDMDERRVQLSVDEQREIPALQNQLMLYAMENRQSKIRQNIDAYFGNDEIKTWRSANWKGKLFVTQMKSDPQLIHFKFTPAHWYTASRFLLEVKVQCEHLDETQNGNRLNALMSRCRTRTLWEIPFRYSPDPISVHVGIANNPISSCPLKVTIKSANGFEIMQTIDLSGWKDPIGPLVYNKPISNDELRAALHQYGQRLPKHIVEYLQMNPRN